MRRFLRPFLNLVIAGGVVLALWPIGQTLYGRWNQRALAAQWQHEQKPVSKASGKPQKNKFKLVQAHTKTRGVGAASNAPTLAVAAGGRAKPWPLTKLSVPDIGIETFIVQGWDDAALRRGPGHLPQSGLAGQGNCIVAGHRNVYGSPFYRLEEIMPGATITLENRTGTFNYTVNAVFPTPDTNLQILQPPAVGEAPRLTLVTCTLPHTNNRIVVQALLAP